jgi:KDO2-lipid IV(A) lauroyltransferase
MKKQLTYLAYASAWSIVKALPDGIAYRGAQSIADRATKKGGRGIERLRANYARVHPEWSQIELDGAVHEGMRSYLRYWCDTFRMPRWSNQEIVGRVEVVNEHLLRDALSAGKGCIVSLPHSGNWDHAGAYFCKTGAPVVTVAEHLEPEKLFRKFLAYRESLGMEVFDANARVLALLAQRLRQNRLIALVADRDLSDSGLLVDFCGGSAKMPAGPALLSIQTGAPLLTAFVTYRPNGIHILFEEAITIPSEGTNMEKAAAMIQVTAHRLEKNLKSQVIDWHMLQKIWID